jgi:hypothetical protein
MSKRIWVLLGVIIVVIIVGGLIRPSLAYLKDTEQATNNTNTIINSWWDLNWHWRRTISVSNGGSAITSPCAYKVTIPYYTSLNHNMQTNFGDIRFTDSNNRPLPYYMESYNPSTSAIVWVELTTIPAGASSFYLYYGNSAATDTSDGANTFIYFDDFESGTLNTTDATTNNFWSILQPTRGTADFITASTGNHGSKYLRLRNTSTTSNGFGVRAALPLQQTLNTVIEYWAQPVQTSALWEMQGLDNNGTPRIGPRMTFNASANTQYYNGGTATNALTGYTATHWYQFTWSNINPTTHVYQPYIGVDGGTPVSYGTNPGFNNAACANMKYISFFDSTSAAVGLYIDYVKLRLYYDPTIVTYSISSTEN